MFDERLPARIWARIIPEPMSGCWLWIGAPVDRAGYCQVRTNGVYRYVHRVVYEALVGPIPEGLQIDHRCNVTCCVNPDHLRPMSARDNTLRGNAWSAKAARRKTCNRGHEYTPASWSSRPELKRTCLICKREWNRNYARAKYQATRSA